MKRLVAILGTVDTKKEELWYLKQLIAEGGFTPYLVDVGIFPLPSQAQEGVDFSNLIDVTNDQVSLRGGQKYENLLTGKNRDEVMTIMGEGSRKILDQLFQEGRLAGVIAVGGNQGSAISAMAMRGLPFGLPKLLVSTVASGNIRPFVGHQDIMVVFSVADMIGSLNPVSQKVMRNAAGAIMGMIQAIERDLENEKKPKGIVSEQLVAPLRGKGRKRVAISALGNTQKAVDYLIARLQKENLQPVAFHSSGAGGSAMEELIEEGYFDGIIDLTPHELSEEVMESGIYQPTKPGRMTAAAKMGIPAAYGTGGMEYLCFGPAASIPKEMKDHLTYMHNPYNANVALTAEDLKKVAAVMARRLNQATGPAAVLVPLRGWSVYGAPEGPFHNPEVYLSFIEVLKSSLNPSISYQEMDTVINDELFAARLADTFLDMLI